MQSRRIRARGAVSSHATVSPKVQDAKTKIGEGCGDSVRYRRYPPGFFFAQPRTELALG